MKNVFICVKKGRILALFICILLIFSHIILYLKIDYYREIIDSFNHKIFNSFNRDETDGKDDNIFFVSFFNDKNLGKQKPKLKLPSKEEYTNIDGTLQFNLKENFVVKCAGYGIVKCVGYLENGLKYVEIKHSGNITTRYENLKVVGVGANFIVKDIHILGTCKENLIFKILKDNLVINNYEIIGEDVVWKE